MKLYTLLNPKLKQKESGTDHPTLPYDLQFNVDVVYRVIIHTVGTMIKPKWRGDDADNPL
jgi:hypothetical protein